MKWLHHLLEPHCEHCREERETNRVCQSCETLKSQLATANHREQQLLVRILELTNPVKPEPRQIELPPEALKPKYTPWEVKRQMLEENDREKARVIAQNKKQTEEVLARNKSQSVEQLEKELGVEEVR